MPPKTTPITPINHEDRPSLSLPYVHATPHFHPRSVLAAPRILKYPLNQPEFLRDDYGRGNLWEIAKPQRGSVTRLPRSQHPIQHVYYDEGTPPTPKRPADHVFRISPDMKDTTIHLEHDVIEDLEPELDEFSRLSRLGNFHAANQFFQANLEEYVDNPYIFVQYANMLLEMGDYKNLKALKVPHGLAGHGEPANKALVDNWNAIYLFSTFATEGLSPSNGRKLRGLIRSLEGIELESSTECLTLSLVWRILALVRYDEVDVELLDWSSFFDELLREARVWDFMDIFNGAVRYYGRQTACAQIFKRDRGLPWEDQIIQRWSTALYADESATLALLDILVSIVLVTPPTADLQEKSTLVFARSCINKAGDLIPPIIKDYPRSVKSRQYLRWILAKVAVTDCLDTSPSYLASKVPGMLRRRTFGDLYIYIAAASETPDWDLLYVPSNSIKELQMVLETAKELEDHQTEVLCLKQLILHSLDPLKYFDELIHLQRSVQHDLHGWLQTSVSKYIICRDQISREALRKEILSIRDYEDLDKDLLFSARMVLKALANSNDESKKWLDEASSLISTQPQPIRNFMKRNWPYSVTLNRPNDKYDVIYSLPSPVERRQNYREDRRKEDENPIVEIVNLGPEEISRSYYPAKPHPVEIARPYYPARRQVETGLTDVEKFNHPVTLDSGPISNELTKRRGEGKLIQRTFEELDSEDSLSYTPSKERESNNYHGGDLALKAEALKKVPVELKAKSDSGNINSNNNLYPVSNEKPEEEEEAPRFRSPYIVSISNEEDDTIRES